MIFIANPAAISRLWSKRPFAGKVRHIKMSKNKNKKLFLQDGLLTGLLGPLGKSGQFHVANHTLTQGRELFSGRGLPTGLVLLAFSERLITITCNHDRASIHKG